MRFEYPGLLSGMNIAFDARHLEMVFSPEWEDILAEAADLDAQFQYECGDPDDRVACEGLQETH